MHILLLVLSLLLRPDVQMGTKQIYHDTFKIGIESGFVVYSDHVVFVGGNSNEIEVAPSLLKGSFALFHTHKDKQFPKPSPQDIETAKTYKISVYTLSQDELWVVNAEGVISQVEFPDFIRKGE